MGDRNASEFEGPAARLLARWQETGDLEALESLLAVEVKSLGARIRGTSGGQLTASVNASDVAQEAVYRLLDLEEPPHFPNPAAMRQYLWQTAWRLLIDRMRRSSRKVVLPADESLLASRGEVSGGLGRVEEEDRRTALLFVLNLMKPEQRDILERVYFQNESVETAAAALGIERGAANMRLVRARRELAQKLKSWNELIG